MARWPFLLALALVPGCFDGGCGVAHYGEAQVTAPGAFARLVAHGANVTLPPPGFPYPAPANGSTVSIDWWPPQTGRTVGMFYVSGPGARHFGLTAPGIVETSAGDRTPAAFLQDQARQFLENVTGGDAAEIGRWSAALLVNRTDTGMTEHWQENGTWQQASTYEYRVQVPRLRPDLGTRLGIGPASGGDIGKAAGAGAGPWAFGYALPVATMEGPEGLLEADPLGRAAIHLAYAPATREAAATQAAQWFEAEGLGPSPFAASTFQSGPIC